MVISVSVALVFIVFLFSRPFWPAFLSYQDPIDPTNLTEYYDPLATTSIYNNQIYPVPTIPPAILGDTDDPLDDSTRRIEVDLTNQHLYAYEDGYLIYDFLISSGTWGRTPQGTFTIWAKVRSQKMSGGSQELGTYYYLPNVPYVLFFYNEKVPKRVGYSIHGTYWHDNFGTPMSHGCINMRTPEVAQIYDWADVGTQIVIYGKYTYQDKS